MTLPLGAIKPCGWIRRQLEIQAEGLSGHLDEFWPDVRDSGWIGGSAEGWERAPYWLDGLVPLAFLLSDDRLIAKADRWMGYIVEHQQSDGWLGPAGNWHGLEGVRDPWPQFVILKALAQYAEARGEDKPGGRSFEAILAALRAIADHIDRLPLFAWNQYRWGDLLVVLLWVMRRRRYPWAETLAERIHNQGYDWDYHFARFPFAGRSDRWTFDRHVVNNAMGIKTPGLWELYRTGNMRAETALGPIRRLDEHHGQATGMFSGDECLAGRMPSQGTELCAVVEYLYSLEQLLAQLSDTAFSDRLELIALNALPAAFSPDMWAHQYDQQVNQVQCVVVPDHLYTTNNEDANIYGLEPHFGCCTANMHQGFPKLVSSLWVSGKNGGLRAVSYLPCEVSVETSAGPLAVRVDGSYPLNDEVEITVIGDGETDTETPLELPIPSWARGATLTVDGGPPRPVAAGSIQRLVRNWRGRHEIRLKLPMRIRVEFRYNGAASVYRGPLLYALQPEESWSHLRGEPPHADYEVRPQEAWNLAIGLCEGDDSFGLRAEPFEVDVEALTTLTAAPSAPFAPAALSPTASRQTTSQAWRIPVTVRSCPSWGLERGAAAPPPESPVAAHGPEETKYLVPYASTGLRLAEIPWFWIDRSRT